MKKLLLFIFAGITFFACSTMDEKVEKFEAGTQNEASFSKNEGLNYLIYLPENYSYDEDNDFPLLLFLHGMGERGDSLDMVKTWGPPKIAEERGLPFIVVSPQCPITEQWISVLSPLKGLLDEVINEYNVDTNRVYLTGLSMGGFGTFAFSQMHPEYFAAIAPVCGGGTPSLAGFAKSLPTWVFHGDDDPVVPLESSQIMVDALKEHGAEVKFTIYPGVGHLSWVPAYNESGLFEWFLQHKKTDN